MESKLLIINTVIKQVATTQGGEAQHAGIRPRLIRLHKRSHKCKKTQKYAPTASDTYCLS